MKIQLMNKKEDCEKLEEYIVSLRNEVDKLGKNMKSSQSLDGIPNCHRSPFNKMGIGYIGESP